MTWSLQSYGDMPKKDVEHIEELLQEAADKYGLRVGLLKAIVGVESGWNQDAINRRTFDYGLMQINKVNLKAFGHTPTTIMDVRANVDVGARILKQLKNRFGTEANWACRYQSGWGKEVPGSRTCKTYMVKLRENGYIVDSELIAVAD